MLFVVITLIMRIVRIYLVKGMVGLEENCTNKSVQPLAMDWMFRGSNPDGGERFSAPANHFPYKMGTVFFGGKAAKAWI